MKPNSRAPQGSNSQPRRRRIVATALFFFVTAVALLAIRALSFFHGDVGFGPTWQSSLASGLLVLLLTIPGAFASLFGFRAGRPLALAGVTLPMLAVTSGIIGLQSVYFDEYPCEVIRLALYANSFGCAIAAAGRAALLVSTHRVRLPLLVLDQALAATLLAVAVWVSRPASSTSWFGQPDEMYDWLVLAMLPALFVLGVVAGVETPERHGEGPSENGHRDRWAVIGFACAAGLSSLLGLWTTALLNPLPAVSRLTLLPTDQFPAFLRSVESASELRLACAALALVPCALSMLIVFRAPGMRARFHVSAASPVLALLVAAAGMTWLGHIGAQRFAEPYALDMPAGFALPRAPWGAPSIGSFVPVKATDDVTTEDGQQRVARRPRILGRFDPQQDVLDEPTDDGAARYAAEPATSLIDLAWFADAQGSYELVLAGRLPGLPFLPPNPSLFGVIRLPLSEKESGLRTFRTGDGWAFETSAGRVNVADADLHTEAVQSLLAKDVSVTLAGGRPTVGDVFALIEGLSMGGTRAVSVNVPLRFWDPLAEQRCQVLKAVLGADPAELVVDGRGQLPERFTMPGMSCGLGDAADRDIIWSCASPAFAGALTEETRVAQEVEQCLSQSPDAQAHHYERKTQLCQWREEDICPLTFVWGNRRIRFTSTYPDGPWRLSLESGVGNEFGESETVVHGDGSAGPAAAEPTGVSR